MRSEDGVEWRREHLAKLGTRFLRALLIGAVACFCTNLRLLKNRRQICGRRESVSRLRLSCERFSGIARGPAEVGSTLPMPPKTPTSLAAGTRLAHYGFSACVSTPVFSSPGETMSVPGLSPDGREIFLVITKRQAEIVLAKLTGGGKQRHKGHNDD